MTCTAPSLRERLLEMSSPVKKVVKCSEVLQVAKLSDAAVIPTKGSASAAGYDLYSAYDYTIPARGKVLAKTDLQVKVPHGTYGRVAPRSGLAWKNHIDIELASSMRTTEEIW